MSSQDSIHQVNLEGFNREFNNLAIFFRYKGFYKHPNPKEIDLFSRFVDFQVFLRIISERLCDEIHELNQLDKQIINKMMKEEEINDKILQNYLINFGKIQLDLSDFFIYTRIFLDTLTKCIKTSFLKTGYKKYAQFPESSTDLLRDIEKYKFQIDRTFLENLGLKMTWVLRFTEHRNGLVHKLYHFVFTNTRNGKFGFDVINEIRRTWGTNTVKSIINEIQDTVNQIEELLRFLSGNLSEKKDESV